jgi:ribosome maturation factor RimP
VLEVSSPGADRPIRTDDDVRRNVGRRVLVRSPEPIEGRRELRGLLVAGRPGRMTVRLDDAGEVEIALSEALQVRQEVGF